MKQRFIACSVLVAAFIVLASAAAFAAPIVYPSNGDYYIVPYSHSNFAIDVKGGGQAPETTPIWLFEKNNSDAQIFNIRRVNGDWYLITHKRTGLCINVQGGNNNNDARLWLYHNDNTDSCFWRFGKISNGVYVIQSKLGNQRVIDLDNNRASNGSIVHLWDYHEGASARWRLISVPSSGFIWPIPGCTTITTTYYYSSGKPHSCRYSYNGKPAGIDIAASVGTNVVAAASGTVITLAQLGNRSFGNYLEIQHDDGTKTLYAHLNSFNVRKGQRVNQGDVIGKSGKTGNVTGPHLHFEMENKDTYQYYKSRGVIR